jgi:hypothetical protein
MWNFPPVLAKNTAPPALEQAAIADRTHLGLAAPVEVVNPTQRAVEKAEVIAFLNAEPEVNTIAMNDVQGKNVVLGLLFFRKLSV